MQKWGVRGIAQTVVLGVAMALFAPALHAQVVVPVEVFAGRATGDLLPGGDQTMVGGAAGVEFGRAGLHAVYGWGLTSDVRGLTGYEAGALEGRVRLWLANPHPYLLLGAGRIRTAAEPVAEEEDPEAVIPGLRSDALVVGGGLEIGLTRGLRLNLAVRDHIVSTASAEDGRARELSHTWLLSGGVQVRLGTPPRAVAPAAPPVVVRAPAPGVAPGQDTIYVGAADVQPPRDYISDRMLTVPVPQQGAIYLRYGPDQDPAGALPPELAALGAGGDVRATLRSLISEELAVLRAPLMLALPQAGVAAPGVGAVTDVQLELLERRIADRLEGVLVQRVDQALAAQTAQQRAALQSLLREELQRQEAQRAERDRRLLADMDRVVTERLRTGFVQLLPGDTVPTLVVPEAPAARRRFDWFPADVRAYTGGNVNEPVQALVGVRAGLGTLTPQGLRFVPEFAAGLGDALSFMLAGNVLYAFQPVRVFEQPVVPHLMAGAGLLVWSGAVDRARQEGVLNFAYGLSFEVTQAGDYREGGRIHVFVEHQGIDLYDLHRLLLGLRWTF
jgi:hypothetical protein